MIASPARSTTARPISVGAELVGNRNRIARGYLYRLPSFAEEIVDEAVRRSLLVVVYDVVRRIAPPAYVAEMSRRHVRLPPVSTNRSGGYRASECFDRRRDNFGAAVWPALLVWHLDRNCAYVRDCSVTSS